MALNCRNGHTICHTCLSTRQHMQQMECCVCRDDRVFYPSPFCTTANHFGMQWTCADCEVCCPLTHASAHRAVCPCHVVPCPVDGCGRHVKRRDLASHLRQDHTANERVVVENGVLGAVVVGGGGIILAVWEGHVVQIWACGHTCLIAQGESYYSLQVSTFHTPMQITVRNVEYGTCATKELAHVTTGVRDAPLRPPPTSTRMRALYHLKDCINAFSVHAFDVPGTASVETAFFRVCRKHNSLPQSATLLGGDSGVFDVGTPTRGTVMTCLTFEFATVKKNACV